MRYRLRTLLIVLAVGPMVLLEGCSARLTPSRPLGKTFDAAAWRSADPNKEGDREIRGSMVDDLLARQLLNGLGAAEVEQLLGSPATESERKMAGMDDETWQLCYHLGPTRDMPIDEEFLMIRLNGDGKVAEYHVVPN